MKSVNLIVLSLIVASCASIYRRPESIQEKMTRYKTRDKRINQVPSYSTNIKKIKPTRYPASTTSGQDISMSNKNLYFISLYEQYETFSTLFPQYSQKLNHCAFFHQPMISYKTKNKKWDWSLKNSSEISKKKIVKALPSDNFQNAIRDHMKRNFQEVEKLCHTGQSSNYYIYENLITLIKQKQIIRQDIESLNSLYKISLFFNEKLLNEIATKKRARSSGRGLASTKQKVNFSQEALHRINATWAESLTE